MSGKGQGGRRRGRSTPLLVRLGLGISMALEKNLNTFAVSTFLEIICFIGPALPLDWEWEGGGGGRARAAAPTASFQDRQISVSVVNLRGCFFDAFRSPVNREFWDRQILVRSQKLDRQILVRVEKQTVKFEFGARQICFDRKCFAKRDRQKWSRG